MQNPRSRVRVNKLRIRRERKRFQRKRKIRNRSSGYSPYVKILALKRSYDRKLIKRFRSPLLAFLLYVDFVDGSEQKNSVVVIPEDFSFCNSYDKTMGIIKDVIGCIIYSPGQTLTIDFGNCQFADHPALFFLKVIFSDFEDQFARLDKMLSVLNVKLTIEIKKSKNEQVNYLLFAHHYLEEMQIIKKGMIPWRGMDYFKGSKSQAHYAENKKGVIVTRIRGFLNHCLRDHGYEFNHIGTNELDGLLSEILGNGEDHSPFDAYHACVNAFIEASTDKAPVTEVNFSVMNFGFSIYQGLERSKTENFENYSLIESYYQHVLPSINTKIINKESLFTLYSLQEGVSRLKYEDESRGHGTMKFINSFFALGDFEDHDRHYHPELTIISGSSKVVCNNTYKPQMRDNVFYLSLNPENDLLIPPDPKNLKILKSYFPGRILSVKIYLDKDHLRKKIVNNEQRN